MATFNFSDLIQKFFMQYLPMRVGATNRTIDTYRYSLMIFLKYIEEIKGIKSYKISIENFNYNLVSDFLDWLEQDRKNSISTRNNRKAALDSFAHFVNLELPDFSGECRKILEIPVKRFNKKEISYLKPEGIRLWLSQIDKSSKSGFRDYCMFLLMYGTGIRVSELISIKVCDIRFDEPATILIHGKGRKDRIIPIVKKVREVLYQYIDQNKLFNGKSQLNYLFLNHSGQQFKRQGINYLVKKYTKKAHEAKPELIPLDFSPHKIRHTAAMELLASGVDIMYIRDILGHKSVTTTEVYAKVDSDHKRKQLEAHSLKLVDAEVPEWQNNKDLISWLRNFGKI